MDALIRTGRKGAVAALRDAQLIKTIYAWGLRRREALQLDLYDLRTNPKADRWGRYGLVHVRYGKASRGSVPKRRSVLSFPNLIGRSTDSASTLNRYARSSGPERNPRYG